MPIALPRGDRVAQWDPRHTIDNYTSPCPLFSGHLLKLGSNDRWQSRLFTFDGAVLTCVGKRPRTPPITTYDPHVSSPFVSASCHPQPYNPNTKWFLNLSSITDIRLLPSSRTYRCFPYTDTSRSLFIQTTDGRTLNLRAKKDIDLDRWYFVLAKIWSYQYLLQHPMDNTARGSGRGFSKEEEAAQQNQQHLSLPHYHTEPLHAPHPHHRLHHNQRPHHPPQPHRNGHHHRNNQPAPFAASLLPAHQQSTHLFKKYLQRQQYQHDPQEYQPAQPHSPQRQQQHNQQHFHPLKRQQHTLPVTNNREDFMGYKISPQRPAFIPQGFDWSHHQHDDDNHDELEDDEGGDDDEEDNIRVILKTSFQDSPPVSGDSKANNPNSSNDNTAKNESMEQQRGSWSLELNSMPATDLLLSNESSPDLLAFRQPIVWPVVGSMEPAKAAAVDMWRHSLLSPLLMEDVQSRHSEDQDQDHQVMGVHKNNIILGGQRPSADHTRDRIEPGFIGCVLEYADDHGIDSPLSSQSRPKWFRYKEQHLRPRLAMENPSSNASADGAIDYDPLLMYNRPHQRSLQPPSCRRDDDTRPQSMAGRRRHIVHGGHDIRSGVGPQDYFDNRIPISKEDNILAQEHAMAIKKCSMWQNPQLSSEEDSGADRDSYIAQHRTPDMTGASYAEVPSRDSYMNLTRHERDLNPNLLKNDLSNIYLLPSKPLPPKRTQPARTNISSKTTESGVKKKGILTSILKRPSLPGMDTATLAAAVAASASSAAISKKTRIVANQSSSVEMYPSVPDPSTSLHRSKHSYFPIHDSNFMFPRPSVGSRMMPITDQRFPEPIGPLSTSSSSMNKDKHVFTPVRAVTTAAAAVRPPPVRPPRRHPVENKAPGKPCLGVPKFEGTIITSSSISYDKRGSLSSPEPVSPIVAQSSIQRHHDDSKLLIAPQPEDMPRRNSAPVVTLLGLGLDMGEGWSSSKEFHLTPVSREEPRLSTDVVNTLTEPRLDHQKNVNMDVDDDENEREEQRCRKEKERAIPSPLMRHVQTQHQQQLGYPQEQRQHQDSEMAGSILSVPSLHRYSSTSSFRKSRLMEKHHIHRDDEDSSAPSDERFCYF